MRYTRVCVYIYFFIYLFHHKMVLFVMCLCSGLPGQDITLRTKEESKLFSFLRKLPINKLRIKGT